MKNGIKVINSTIGKFKGIVKNLDKGVKLCDAKKTKNLQKVSKLDTQNSELDQKAKQAIVFRDNLQTMMTEELPKKAEKKSEKKEENKKD